MGRVFFARDPTFHPLSSHCLPLACAAGECFRAPLSNSLGSPKGYLKPIFLFCGPATNSATGEKVSLLS